MNIQNNLAQFRMKRGLAAKELAKQIGVTRQTIYAIETGTYMPNTLLALKLAQVLEASVEQLFKLESPKAPPHTEGVMVLPTGQEPQAGLPVQLCEVNEKLVAVLPAPIVWTLSPADAVLIDAGKPQSGAKTPFTQKITCSSLTGK
jgi:putative molybdopterin biosynthesis protein